MSICVLDTETTSIPKYNNWNGCYIIQLAYIIVQKDLLKDENVTLQKSFIVKTPVPSSNESEAIHHITWERVQSEGIDCKNVLMEFAKDLKENSVEIIMSHGIEFDMGFLMKEFERNHINPNFFRSFKFYNTKNSPLYHSQKGGLSTIVKTSFKGNPHDALYDCYLCLEFFRITKRAVEEDCENEPEEIVEKTIEEISKAIIDKALKNRIGKNVENVLMIPFDNWHAEPNRWVHFKRPTKRLERTISMRLLP